MNEYEGGRRPPDAYTNATYDPIVRTGSGGTGSPAAAGGGLAPYQQRGNDHSPSRGPGSAYHSAESHTPPPQLQNQPHPQNQFSGAPPTSNARPQSYYQQGTQSMGPTRGPPAAQLDNSRPMSMSYNGRPGPSMQQELGAGGGPLHQSQRASPSLHQQSPSTATSLSGHGRNASRSQGGPASPGLGAAEASQPGGGIKTIAGEPLHDLGRAIALLKCSKFYSEGFLMLKVEVGPDGKSHPNSPDSQWSKWFVQLSGTIMSTWNAAEMEQAARENRTVPPRYLNLADAFLHPYPPSPRGPPTPTAFQFALNSAGLNRYLFCAPSLQSLTMWINAIRLACWEKSRCNEIYTGTLIGLREPRTPMGWEAFEVATPALGPKGKLEGWLKARLPGDTEWRRVWTTVTRGASVPGSNGAAAAAAAAAAKKNKRNSLLSFGRRNTMEAAIIDDLPGDGNFSTIAFYTEKPTKREQPLCVAQHLFYAAALFPESEKLMDVSALFKIEGTFLNPADGFKMGWGVGGRAEKQGYALLMVDEGDAMAMLGWVVGLSEAFKLYGKPKGFSFDPRDPSSLYFALPVGPHRDRHFLDRELVDTLDINESRPRAIRAVFHNILFDRMRGIRPSALGPPPGTPPNSRNVEALEAQAQKDEALDEQKQAPQRNFATQNGNLTSSPAKLQHVLPAIGETSPIDQPGPTEEDVYEAPRATPSVQNFAPVAAPTPERSNLAPSAGGGDLLHTEPGQLRDTDQVSSAHSDRRSQPRSDADHLATYEAFLASDISRDPSPPPSGPASQPYRSSPAYSSPPPINTSAVPAGTFSDPAPARGSPYTDSPPTQSDVGTNLTHLTYAARSAAGGRDPYNTIIPPTTQSPIYTAPLPAQTALPSPGASTTSAGASMASVSLAGASMTSPLSTSMPMVAQRSDDGLAYMEPSPVRATQPNFSPAPRGSSPVNESIAHPVSSRSARSPEAIHDTHANNVVAEPVVNPSQKATDLEEPSKKRLSNIHDGKIVDSPESIALSAAPDPIYSTQPLFSPPPAQPFPGSTSTEANGTPASSRGPLNISTSSTDIHSSLKSSGGKSFDMPEEYGIHSDLLAGLDYLQRTETPGPTTVPNTPSTTTSSPQVGHGFSYPVGPPSRALFKSSLPMAPSAPSPLPPVTETVAAPPAVQETPPSPSEPPYDSPTFPEENAQTTPKAANATFPSTFGNNKRDERAASALIAQQAAQAALHRPGRTGGADGSKGKRRAWQDSDEEDEPEDEDEDESVEQGSRSPADGQRRAASDAPARSPYSRPPSASPQGSPGASPRAKMLPMPPSDRPTHLNSATRQSYYENGPSNPGGRTPPVVGSPSMRDLSLDDDPSDQPTVKPILNPTGLLHAGIIDKEERSARAQEYMARDTGGPLVSLPAKPPPPQTGLVGAITSHQRDKERSGGVGRALTEQMRERKVAEQRTRQMDELQKQQLVQQQAQMQQQQQQQQMMMGGFNPYMNPYAMMNPYGMAGGFGMGLGMGSPPMGSPSAAGGSQLGHGRMASGSDGEGEHPRSASPVADQHQAMMLQQQAMFQAQMAAQAAYAAAMAQFQQPHAGMSPSPSMMSMGPGMSMPPAMSGMGMPPMSMPFMSPSFYPQQGLPTSSSFTGQPFTTTASPFGYNPYSQPSTLGHQHEQQRAEEDFNETPSGDSSPFGGRAKTPVEGPSSHY